mgnify:CR=1 FL=1
MTRRRVLGAAVAVLALTPGRISATESSAGAPTDAVSGYGSGTYGRTPYGGGDDRHESGVPRATFDAVAGPDGTLDREDLLDAVAAYAAGRPVDGVVLSRSDVLALVGYYADG